MADNDSFFVGYLPNAPAPLVAFLRKVVGGLLVLAAVVAGVAVFAQRPFAHSRFEFGVLRGYEGLLQENPYPILTSGNTQWLLVAPGKHGADDLLRGQSGRNLSVRGSLIEREGASMLEIDPATVHVVPGLSAVPAFVQDLGQVRMTGEIVDGKCYLGVMNPGEGKVHRSCAARCISGGVPVLFIGKDDAGQARRCILTGADRRALNREVLPWVAEPIALEGRLESSGQFLTLRTETSSFRRLK